MSESSMKHTPDVERFKRKISNFGVGRESAVRQKILGLASNSQDDATAQFSKRAKLGLMTELPVRLLCLAVDAVFAELRDQRRYCQCCSIDFHELLGTSLQKALRIEVSFSGTFASYDKVPQRYAIREARSACCFGSSFMSVKHMRADGLASLHFVMTDVAVTMSD
ncbi:hypothetical protein BJ508DRAFT_304213 [Ascobolus immersus RN42]|uniref:Uncharacterized protein n=1 Tax=Ascobolus immersus RN42 TaxID=1160509 RepID=A0A3N4IF22_ASCIM|nr:hypothetical protein BJ508DRAFT_304213 [Ascobolus immersus RN42]